MNFSLTPVKSICPNSSERVPIREEPPGGTEFMPKAFNLTHPVKFDSFPHRIEVVQCFSPGSGTMFNVAVTRGEYESRCVTPESPTSLHWRKRKPRRMP